MEKTKLLGLIILMVAALLTCEIGCAKAPKAPATEVIVLKGQYVLKKGHTVNVTQDYMQSEIEKATNGRIRFDMRYGAELVPIKEAMDALSKGTIDCLSCIFTHYTGRVPSFLLVQLPFLPVESPRVAFEFYEDTFIWDVWTEGAERLCNAHLLHGTAFCPPAFILLRNKRVTKLEDMKGLRVKATPGANTEATKLLGAAPSFVTPPEYYTSLQTGVVDGLVLSYYAMDDYRLSELVTSITTVPLGGGGPVGGFFINLDVWKKIPKDLQEKIDAAASSRNLREYAIKWHEDDFARRQNDLKKLGIEIVDLPPAEMARWNSVAGVPTWKWVAAQTGEPIGSRFLNLISEKLSVKF